MLLDYHGPPVADADGPELGGLGDLFALKSPKDAMSGTIHLVRNVLTGVVVGVSSLVVAPAIGAKEDGARGFATGVVKGIGMCVFMPIVGAATGVGQFCRGIGNTPKAVTAKQRGMQWDREQAEWIYYNLKEEADKVLSVDEKALLGKAGSAPGAGRHGSLNGEKVVADMAFYDILGALHTRHAPHSTSTAGTRALVSS